MKIALTNHVLERRGASSDLIQNEIRNGLEIKEEIARPLLGRFAENRRFKDLDDKYIISNYCYGMYILTKKPKCWVAITYIDLELRREYVKKLLTSVGSDILTNYNFHFTKAVYRLFSSEQVSEIKIWLSSVLNKREDKEFYIDLPSHFGEYRIRVSVEKKYVKVCMSM